MMHMKGFSASLFSLVLAVAILFRSVVEIDVFILRITILLRQPFSISALASF